MKSLSFHRRRDASLLAAGMIALLLGGQPSHAQQAPVDEAGLAALITAAQAEGTVMAYGSTSLEQIGDVYKGFEAKYGIKVEYFIVVGSKLTARFAGEYEAGANQADILTGGDLSLQIQHPEWFQTLGDENFPNFSNIPELARVPSNLAISHAVAAFSVIYSTDKLTEETRPHTWQELADPKWKGQTLLVDPRSSAIYMSGFKMINDMYPDLLPRLAANEPRLTESAVPAAQQLAAGTGSFAYIGYESNAEALIEKGAPLGAKPIQDPEVARRQWISVVAGPHPNAGRLLAHYLISHEGLTFYCKNNESNKTLIDPTGENTNCARLSDTARILDLEPISKEDRQKVADALHLE